MEAETLPLTPRSRHLLALEFGDLRDFDDPALEWRRLFAELLGTFFLVLVAAGGGLLRAKGEIGLAASVVAPGPMVIILFMGAVSGAHLNPAVSVAFDLRGDFPWKRLPGYVLAQLGGAGCACLFLAAVFGNVEHLGATLPGPGYHDWQALMLETVLTFGLVSVILGTASAAQNVGAIAALGVSRYIALWIYLVGPIAGALVAVGFAVLLRGPGGTPISRAAGSGLLDPGSLEARQMLARRIEAGEADPSVPSADHDRRATQTEERR